MNAPNERKSYSLEFKLEAVRLSVESGRPVAHIADELGIPHGMLYKWRRIYSAQGDVGFKKKTGLSEDQQEIKRLRLENKRLREEREILKKAAAFFAREPK